MSNFTDYLIPPLSGLVLAYLPHEVLVEEIEIQERARPVQDIFISPTSGQIFITPTQQGERRIALSPDEKEIYVVKSSSIQVFDLKRDGHPFVLGDRSSLNGGDRSFPFKVKVKDKVKDEVKAKASREWSLKSSWSPRAIALFQSKVYVTDDQNYSIRVFSSMGEHLQTLQLGRGEDLCNLSGMTISEKGIIHVTDLLNDCIHILDREGEFHHRLWMSKGNLGFPLDIGLYGNNIYVVDQHHIKVFKLLGFPETPELNLLRQWEHDAINCPFRIKVLSNGTIALLNGKSSGEQSILLFKIIHD
jgi:DNA-binding beta-propeller fold protein YncE